MSNQQFDVNIKEGNYDYKKWFFEKLLPLILGTLVITGGLSVYNKKSELTKFTFQTEYKPLVEKGIECANLHQEYISEIETYSGLSKIMNDKFGFERMIKYGNSPEFSNGFLATMESWHKAKESQSKLRKNVKGCYQVLNAGYENLSILLGSEHQKIESDNEQVKTLKRKLKEKNDELKKIDAYKIFDALTRPMSEREMKNLLSQNHYQLLSDHSIATANLEIAIANQQFAEFNKTRRFYSKILTDRFGNGVIRSIPEMWY
jgi:hypothetical protein